MNAKPSAKEVIRTLKSNAGVNNHAAIMLMAADLIESLQAELDGYKATGLTSGDVKDLQGLCKEKGLYEYVDLIVESKRELTKANERSIEQDERIERLETQLAASKRREDSAVADLSTYKDCDFCAHLQDQQYCYKNCQIHVDVDNFRTHPCWQWRGPVAGEESR